MKNDVSKCFHCGETNPVNSHYFVKWQHQQQALCCPGCQAVAELIITSGLDDFYRLRENTPDKPLALIPTEIEQLNSYNQSEIGKEFINSLDDKQLAQFYIGGISCAACGWLIEKKLSELEYVYSVSVNTVSHIATIEWCSSENNSHLGDILKTIRACGYNASPLLPEQLASRQQAEQKLLLRRLGVAGLGMMQVMMFSVGLYTGAFQGMDPRYQNFLNYVSWLVATPVVFYSASPFFKAGIANLKALKPGMNVPIALAIGSAYISSTFSVLFNLGDVYFDSAVMFTFFLLTGRFLQSRASWRAIQTNLFDTQPLPLSVQTKYSNGWQYDPVSKLKINDIILIRAGEAIPIDGIIYQGTSQISTAVINGEFESQPVQAGVQVISGSINESQPIEIQVTAVGSERYIEKLALRQQQALAARPSSVSLADKISQWFISTVLVITTLTAVYWYFQAPELAFAITLSVLVVTCPCALSLATPAAITAAIARSSKLGFLISNAEIFERLQHCQWLLFDKTGTLTTGKLTLNHIEILVPDITRDEVIEICAAIETGSEHPIAKAFGTELQTLKQGKTFTCKLADYEISQRLNHPLKGISAAINGLSYQLGIFDLETRQNPFKEAPEQVNNKSQQKYILLYKEQQPVAKIYLDDPWRDDAIETLHHLKNKGYKLALLTGDPSITQHTLEQIFPFDYIECGVSAEEKLSWVKNQQKKNETITMIGDGFNDGLVLAGANASIAMVKGATLSKTVSDAVLLNGQLSKIPLLLTLTHKTQAIIKQNIFWAIAYNGTALPLAMVGKISPWMAVIGMSMSSLLVVLNALRINPK